MTEEKRFEDKIKDDLIKSGFPLELKTSTILEENDWNVFPNEYVIEKDTGIEYEIDIRALKSIKTQTEDGNFQFLSFFNLIVECKKCEKHPWVFFMREKKFENPSRLIKHTHDFGINRPYLCKGHNEVSNQVFFQKKIDYSKLNLFSGNERSTSYCQAFRDPNKENQIYFAMRSVLRSLKILTTEQHNHLSQGRFPEILLFTYIPIVVVDNNLFEGRLINGNLEIKESKHIPLIININDKESDKAMIHIIKMDSLAEILIEVTKDMQILHNEFSKISFIRNFK